MEGPTHLQTQFTCSSDRISVPNSPYSIPASVTRLELNDLINQISTTGPPNTDGQQPQKKLNFDFLLSGRLLTGSLGGHVTEHRLSTEEVLEIECVLRDPPPSLSHELEHRDWVSAVHCCKDMILTGCYDGCVRIWTMEGTLVCTAEEHTAPVKSVRWITTDTDKDERLFLSASQDQLVLLWRLTLDVGEAGPQGHATLLHRCKGHARSVEALAVSSDRSKFCSVSWDSFVKIWSTVPDSIPVDEVEQESDLPSKRPRPDSGAHRPTSRTPLATFQGHANAATAAVWGAGPGGDVITGGWDNCIKMWDVETGANKASLNGSKAVHCIDLGEESKLVASGSADKFVRLWDTRQTEACLVHSTLSSHTGWVVSVRWSPLNPHHLLSGSYDSSLRLWDTRSSKKPLFSIAAHEGKVLCSDWSLPQLLASGGTDNKLRTYSLK